MEDQLKIKRKECAPIYPFMALWRTMTVLVKSGPGNSCNVIILDTGEVNNRSRFEVMSVNCFDDFLRLEKGSRFTFTQV